MHRTPAFTPTWQRLAQAAALAATCAAVPALAQTPAAAIAQEPVQTLEQKTERITHQDAGSRIEELRVGGQTRSIEVQTNTAVPGYQVQPIDAGQPSDSKSGAGKSSWRVLKF
ncbi:hypothetical protein [Aquabacterium sp. A08]|uniref:hypothetical protein n=1 Tax=Aquabacterium sp. A08 TaxID=2718532 RepID=UPI00141DEF24|nr:hypothetical protein [Aquabacterium sp. A08]NIC41793.1 hypothetical protein [Aquabacterium sp. A08]NIC41819.1 hypothetical protein [Aquabacterium sp. A08]NIC43496.1 hypothetical protein [Aquabacterium sp. A08]